MNSKGRRDRKTGRYTARPGLVTRKIEVFGFTLAIRDGHYAALLLCTGPGHAGIASICCYRRGLDAWRRPQGLIRVPGLGRRVSQASGSTVHIALARRQLPSTLTKSNTSTPQWETLPSTLNS